MNITNSEIENKIKEKLDDAVKKYGSDIKFTIFEIVSLEKMLIEPNKITQEPSRVIPLSEWNDYHSYPTIGALRQYRFYGEQNGFNEVIEYGGNSGGRLLINEQKFFHWLNKRKASNKVA